VPTTWLAAVDSAHGGKTALNVLGVKNQLGTFYPAKEVWLVQDVFKSQAPKTIEDACGEVAKMALLDLKVWGSTKRKEAQPRLSPGLWPLLPHLIAAKLRFVIKDPQEKLGLRVFLNLGHTLGHALESHFHIGHGHAVRLGVFFSVWLSVEKKIMSQAEANKILLMLEKTWGFDRFEIHKWRRPSRKVLKTLIQRDKKMKAQHNIKFVALEKVGHPLVISVSVEELLDLIERYWTAG
jgi:3-dehydroquinate synthetase